ncbi:flagellar basal body rod protein FlgB [Ruminiclostridium cellobioparum]|uniref:Flagellar basal body rod protein FlgB n=1 Tax=Ruminiclostridium cellobioparum subsp. termitidis CT1112 TaxID=1195236 RepID=S0FRQ0_RUMCE|nr:flagellar basal body rod protein FlgB [Ruminiclostridium cellobioparum]EMS71178.1 flagellar basal-body rod protein FlgB [Ruminiclostridium cellobioparum subsp. termitidis CT1112]
MIQNLYGKSSVLEKSLNAAWARNDVISQNLANVDTPEYKRKDIAFEEFLNDSMGKTSLEGNLTDKRHIPINSGNVEKIEPALVEDNSDSSMRIDGNNVDIDSEMANLAKNQIKYNALIQMINGSYSRIKSVISEGRS